MKTFLLIMAAGVLAASLPATYKETAHGNHSDHNPYKRLNHSSKNIIVKKLKLSTGVSVEFAETGNVQGTPVIFLHGFTDSWKSFSTVAATLPPYMRGLFISLRGHGESDKPTTGYTPKTFSADLSAFMDELNIKSAIIIGHSMGATISQQFAIDYPAKVNGLVLAASFSTFLNNEAVTEMNEYLLNLPDAPDNNFIRLFQQSTIIKPVAPSFIDTVVNESSKLPGYVWKAIAKETLHSNLAPQLKRINVPTLILWGNKDSFCRKQDVEQLLSAIPHAKLIEYDGTGHAIHWEEPVKFVEDIDDFIRSLQGLQGLNPE